MSLHKDEHCDSCMADYSDNDMAFVFAEDERLVDAENQSRTDFPIKEKEHAQSQPKQKPKGTPKQKPKRMSKGKPNTNHNAPKRSKEQGATDNYRGNACNKGQKSSKVPMFRIYHCTDENMCSHSLPLHQDPRDMSLWRQVSISAPETWYETENRL